MRCTWLGRSAPSMCSYFMVLLNAKVVLPLPEMVCEREREKRERERQRETERERQTIAWVM
jgi:hypothetical protein